MSTHHCWRDPARSATYRDALLVHDSIASAAQRSGSSDALLTNGDRLDYNSVWHRGTRAAWTLLYPAVGRVERVAVRASIA